MAAKNSIDLDSDPRVIEGTRLLDAPRKLVFAAFSDPKPFGTMVGTQRLHNDYAFL